MRSASVFLALVPDLDDSPHTDWSSATLSGECARLHEFSIDYKRYRATNLGVWSAFDTGLTGLAFPRSPSS